MHEGRRNKTNKKKRKKETREQEEKGFASFPGARPFHCPGSRNVRIYELSGAAFQSNMFAEDRTNKGLPWWPWKKQGVLEVRNLSEMSLEQFWYKYIAVMPSETHKNDSPDHYSQINNSRHFPWFSIGSYQPQYITLTQILWPISLLANAGDAGLSDFHKEDPQKSYGRDRNFFVFGWDEIKKIAETVPTYS